MKNLEVKEFIRKSAVVALSFVTAISFTGCTLSFDSSNAESGSLASIPSIVTEKYEEVKEVKDTLSELSEYVDTVPLSEDMTDEELEEVFNEIFEDASSIGDEYDLEFRSASLVRVVDGDTIVVNLDGNEAKVRLIGIDTPESVASAEYLERTGKENTEEGFTASEYTKALLENVDTVYLETDVSDTDRYGRLLRYVWLEVPDEISTETIATYMVNGILLSDKIAKPVEYEPDTKYAAEFEEIYEEYTY